MKINNLLDRLSVYEAGKTDKGQNPKSSKRVQKNADRPIAEISDDARLIMRVRQILDQMPDIRPEAQELMKTFQEKIDNGTYAEEISGEDVIDQIKLELEEEKTILD